MSHQQPLQVIASVYLLGLQSGIFTVQDVIAWSDNIIEAKDSPPYPIAELSMMAKAKPADVASKLGEIASYENLEANVKTLLAILNQRLGRSPNMVEQIMNNSSTLLSLSHIDLYSFTDEYLMSLRWLPDEYFNAKNGISLADPKDYLLQYRELLTEYAPFLDTFKALYQEEMEMPWEGL